MDQKSRNTKIMVGCMGATAIIIAAIIGLGQPFAQRIADRYFPQPLSTSIDNPTTGIIYPTVYPTSVPPSIQEINTPMQSSNTETGGSLTSSPTPISTTQSGIDQYEVTPISQEGPLRPHYQVNVGDGIFSAGTFSDGLAPYSEQWLWDNNHFKIQRIRPQENPNGCDISRYNTNLVWISGTTGMQFSINDKVVGTYKIADDPHGYILEWAIKMGDKLCAVGFRSIGYSIIIGPDIYYHYDSYCYRGNCK
jgi:hypothetical protein